MTKAAERKIGVCRDATVGAANSRPYGSIVRSLKAIFLSGIGRGAQRMLVHYPGFVTHWPRALPAKHQFTVFQFGVGEGVHGGCGSGIKGNIFQINMAVRGISAGFRRIFPFMDGVLCKVAGEYDKIRIFLVFFGFGLQFGSSNDKIRVTIPQRWEDCYGEERI